MSVSLCVGEYASVPFCFEGLNLRVYSVEELCYAFMENAFLLDTDIMSDRLLHWLAEECGLTELAGELHPLVHKAGSLSAFVERIMEYVGFNSMEEIVQTRETLKKGAGLNLLEKKKKRIDYLVEQKKYLAAVTQYDALLASWEESTVRGGEPSGSLKADLLYNKGAALAGLMLYEKAADCFLASYELDQNQDTLKSLLAARRLQLRPAEYVDFVAEHPEYREASLALEKEYGELTEQFAGSPASQLDEARSGLRQKDMEKYIEEVSVIAETVKQAYRSMVM